MEPSGVPVAPSPFDRLRARGLIAQSVIAGVSLMAAFWIATGRLVSRGEPPMDSATFALFYLGIGIVLVVRIRASHIDVARLFGPTLDATTVPLTTVAVPLCVLSIAGFWILFLPLSFAAPEYVRRHALDSPASAVPTTVSAWAGQFVVAVVIAPVIEEVFFRGLLLQRWAHCWGTLAAAITSSILFAVCHVELFGHFLFGLVMCALYLRTRSLWLPIAAHALNNFIASAFTLPEVLHPTAPDATMTVAKLQAQWWIGLIVLALGLGLIDAYRRRYWRAVDWRALFRGPVPYESVA